MPWGTWWCWELTTMKLHRCQRHCVKWTPFRSAVIFSLSLSSSSSLSLSTTVEKLRLVVEGFTLFILYSCGNIKTYSRRTNAHSTTHLTHQGATLWQAKFTLQLICECLPCGQFFFLLLLPPPILLLVLFRLFQKHSNKSMLLSITQQERERGVRELVCLFDYLLVWWLVF